MASRREFQKAARGVDAETLRDAVNAVRQGGEADRTQVAAAMAWAGFSCPGAIEAVCDNVAAAWLGCGETPPIPPNLPQAPLQPNFWNAFWSAVDDAEKGYDAASITARVVALGATVHPSFEGIAESYESALPADLLESPQGN